MATSGTVPRMLAVRPASRLRRSGFGYEFCSDPRFLLMGGSRLAEFPSVTLARSSTSYCRHLGNKPVTEQSLYLCCFDFKINKINTNQNTNNTCDRL